MISLKRQLKNRLLIYMAIVMTVLLVVMNVAMQHLVSEYVITRLQHDAESVINVLKRDQQSGWHIDPTHLSTVYDRVRSGHYYVVNIGDRWIRSRSLFDLATPQLTDPEKLSQAITHYYTQAGPGGEHWLVLEQYIEKNQQPIRLWIAEDTQPINQQLQQYMLFTVLLIVILALLQVYLQSNLLDRTFEIFDRLRVHLKSVRSQASMFEQHQVPEEISPMVTEIDRLVEHQHKRIQRTRNAISNLAHEIKRPLQILSLKSPEDSDEFHAVNQILLIVDRELKRARISGVNSSDSNFDADEDIRFLIDMMNRLYSDIAIMVDCQIGPYTSQLDRVDLLELLGNLLDNACKFARHKVQIKLLMHEQSIVIEIEDDGQGVSAESLDKITQRGYRLDETLSGHGLGLTICADIVEIYQGSIKFSDSSLGGLKVTAKLAINR